MNTNPGISNKGKRVISVLILALVIIVGLLLGQYQALHTKVEAPPLKPTVNNTVSTTNQQLSFSSAQAALEKLPIKGRAPKTGYTRAQFGNGWEKSGACDTRNKILARDLQDVIYEANSCLVASGILHDPYTGKTIHFTRGETTSSAVQIDHIVALSDSWQKGAQLLTPSLREQLANDSLELLAVDGPANMAKGDGDAATWLPANKSFRCSYVARQIAVKLKYSLWITQAEHDAVFSILKQCPDQNIPSA